MVIKVLVRTWYYLPASRAVQSAQMNINFALNFAAVSHKFNASAHICFVIPLSPQKTYDFTSKMYFEVRNDSRMTYGGHSERQWNNWMIVTLRIFSTPLFRRPDANDLAPTIEILLLVMSRSVSCALTRRHRDKATAPLSPRPLYDRLTTVRELFTWNVEQRISI